VPQPKANTSTKAAGKTANQDAPAIELGRDGAGTTPGRCAPDQPVPRPAGAALRAAGEAASGTLDRAWWRLAMASGRDWSTLLALGNEQHSAALTSAGERGAMGWDALC